MLLRFPNHAAGGIREAIETQVRANDLWRWRPLNATELPKGSPAELAISLHNCLRCEPLPGQLPGPASLAGSLPNGDIIWVDHLDADRWPVWARFFSQFQHACHAREENRRGLFCVPLVGDLPDEPDNDTALAVHRWGQSLTRLDVTLYLDRLIPQIFPSRTIREVALAVATELSGADPCLGAKLAATGFQLLDDPVPLLAQHGAERGWAAGCVKRPTRYGGVVEWLDGDERINSAAILTTGDTENVRRRVWQGQVKVLYPFIEEQRVKLVPEIECYLRFPLKTSYGPVDRAIDLEIGQLVYFLRDRLPNPTWRLLNVLRNMRHDLAHLRPVKFGDLMSQEFRRLGRLLSYCDK